MRTAFESMSSIARAFTGRMDMPTKSKLRAEHAVIKPAKIRDFLLSTSHPVGRFEAPFFANLRYCPHTAVGA
jgi:hypothetical protein